jgi:UDP-N-acetylmuramoyl-L-alanyl-D-glutamate--2,6-diaminopimelate ligase
MDFDSRKIEANDIFIAIRGTISDGHEYIETAIGNGAVAVVCDTFLKL